MGGRCSSSANVLVLGHNAKGSLEGQSRIWADYVTLLATGFHLLHKEAVDADIILPEAAGSVGV